MANVCLSIPKKDRIHDSSVERQTFAINVDDNNVPGDASASMNRDQQPRLSSSVLPGGAIDQQSGRMPFSPLT